MSTNIKLSKAQISKINQSGESFNSSLGNLDKKVLTNVAIPSARDNLPGLVSNKTSNARNKSERKQKGKAAGKEFTLFILNKDMNYIVKIIKSSEKCVY